MFRVLFVSLWTSLIPPFVIRLAPPGFNPDYVYAELCYVYAVSLWMSLIPPFVIRVAPPGFNPDYVYAELCYVYAVSLWTSLIPLLSLEWHPQALTLTMFMLSYVMFML